MNCDESEELILESLEAALPADQRGALREHLGACSACRQFQDSQARLDAALANSVRPPPLPAGFSARVLVQVDEDLARTAPASIQARRRAAEAEFEARMAALRRGPRALRILSLFDLVGFGVAGLLAGLWLSSLLTRLSTSSLPGLPAGWQGSMTQVAWAAAGLIAVAGLVLGRRRSVLARLRF